MGYSPGHITPTLLLSLLAEDIGECSRICCLEISEMQFLTDANPELPKKP